MITAGLCAAPMGIVMMLASPLAARLIARRGPKFTYLAGMVVIALGFSFGVFFVNHLWQAVALAMVIGAGVALSYASAPTLIMRSAPSEQTAAANSVNTLSRSIGTSLASAVHGGILAAAVTAGGVAYGPFNPFQLCFALAVIASAVAIVIAWQIPAESAGRTLGSASPGPVPMRGHHPSNA